MANLPLGPRSGRVIPKVYTRDLIAYTSKNKGRDNILVVEMV